MGDSYNLLNSLPSALLPSLPLNLLSLRVNTADLPFAKSNGRFLFSFCFFLPWSIWPCWLPFEVLFSPWFCETTLLLSLPLVCPPTSLPGLSQATCHDLVQAPFFPYLHTSFTHSQTHHYAGDSEMCIFSPDFFLDLYSQISISWIFPSECPLLLKN